MKRNMAITGVNFNWYPVSDASYGEQFTNRTVGNEYAGDKVEKIIEHEPMGNGYRWYYDIYYSSGAVERVFNINTVFYKPQQS